eukprot:2229296-Pyramimonas_sp.AAC.1
MMDQSDAGSAGNNWKILIIYYKGTAYVVRCLHSARAPQRAHCAHPRRHGVRGAVYTARLFTEGQNPCKRH